MRLPVKEEFAGSIPAPGASCGVPLAERSRHRLPKPDRRVRLPQGTLGDRLTVGPSALNRSVEVQVLLPEPEGEIMCL